MAPDISLRHPIGDQIPFGVSDPYFPIRSVPRKNVACVGNGAACETHRQQERKEPGKKHGRTMAGGKRPRKVNGTPRGTARTIDRRSLFEKMKTPLQPGWRGAFGLFSGGGKQNLNAGLQPANESFRKIVTILKHCRGLRRAAARSLNAPLPAAGSLPRHAPPPPRA